MSKLTKSAQGRDCSVRLPGICNFDPETVVACHLGGLVPGLSGTSQKSLDVLSVRACSACHDEIDRRTRRMEKAVVVLYTLEAFCRDLEDYVNEGLVSYK